MLRKIVKIDEEKCTGCGICIPNCAEGALKIIDGKARLVSDIYCDGLGACLGHCPTGALTIEKREAAPYNETEVIKEMVVKGKNVVIAHLKHLKEHGETEFLKEGIRYLNENMDSLNFDLNEVIAAVHGNHSGTATHPSACGCAGSKEVSIDRSENSDQKGEGHPVRSELSHWPVQMHLINPNAQYFHDSDIVIAADCVAFALGDFHQKFLRGKSLAIACPKLDSGTEIYIEKIQRLIDEAKINTITVMMMEVPCCGGLLQMVKTAATKSERKVPVKAVVVGIAETCRLAEG